MDKIKAIVSFKTKDKNIQLYPSYVDKAGIIVKKEIFRADCNLKNHEHSLYNSDLFVPLLRRAYKEALKNKTAFYLDELPSNITVEGGFMKTVNVEILI